MRQVTLSRRTLLKSAAALGTQFSPPAGYSGYPRTREQRRAPL
jgi:hypothetical protein